MDSPALTNRLREGVAVHPAVRGAYLFDCGAYESEHPDSSVDVGLLLDPGRWVSYDKVRLLSECGQAGIDRIDLVVRNDAPLAVQVEAVRPDECFYAPDGFHHGWFFSNNG